MLKIKIAEIFRHRNETTFRPYLMCKDLFRDVGIDFVFEGNDYDLTWVGQASFCDKNHPYDRMISRGLWFLENKVDGDYILFDGQDSATLMGTYDVFDRSSAKLMLKNTLYSNPSDYQVPSVHGRTYWGSGKDDYSISNIKLDRIKLSGCNWLSTVAPNWFQYKQATKDIDVFALFSYPTKENLEYQIPTNQYYDAHRRRCIDWLRQLPNSINVKMLADGNKLPVEDYYNLMSKSKIVVAPFGYGEMAPRDIESAMVGSILIKPEMSHIHTMPNPYRPQITYAPVKWDFSNLNVEITTLLSKFDTLQEYYVENMRKTFIEEYKPEKLVIHTHKWLSELEGFGVA